MWQGKNRAWRIILFTDLWKKKTTSLSVVQARWLHPLWFCFQFFVSATRRAKLAKFALVKNPERKMKSNYPNVMNHWDMIDWKRFNHQLNGLLLNGVHNESFSRLLKINGKNKSELYKKRTDLKKEKKISVSGNAEMRWMIDRRPTDWRRCSEE